MTVLNNYATSLSKANEHIDYSRFRFERKRSLVGSLLVCGH